MPVSSPVASPLFLPTAGLLTALLGGAWMVLLVVARFDLDRLRSSVLLARWRVWAIIAPIYALAVLGGELPLLALISFLVVQGLREYAKLVSLPKSYERVLVGLGLLPAPVALISLDAFYGLAPVLLIAATLQPLVFRESGGGIRHLAFAALGWGYLAWFLGHLMLLARYIEGGPGILLAIGLATALSDVGAFVVGKRFGRHQLAPRLSPNKTWEGVAGNLAGAYLGIGLVFFALPLRLLGVHLIALPLVIALGALWGDLLESAIKREFQVKDTGRWLPGFGGLLDRIDSLIIVAPLVFYYLRLLESLG